MNFTLWPAVVLIILTVAIKSYADDDPPSKSKDSESGKGNEKDGKSEEEGENSEHSSGSDETCISPGNQYPTISLNLNGHQQAAADTPEEDAKRIKLNRYYAIVRDRFYVQNMDNGLLSIQLHKGEPTSNARIRGPEGDWNYEYILAKINIFWAKKNDYGSQHAILGDSYPFEIQLVHYQKKFSTLSDATSSEHGVLVVCIVYEITGTQNPQLDALTQAALMSTFPQDSMQLAHGPLDLKALFPFDLANIQYTGAYMIQPYCSKGAKFVVFINPRQISYKQLKRFREIRNSDGEKFPGIFFEDEMVTIQKTHLSRNVKLSLMRSEELSHSNKFYPSILLYAIVIPEIILISVKSL